MIVQSYWGIKEWKKFLSQEPNSEILNFDRTLKSSEKILKMQMLESLPEKFQGN